MSEKRTPGTRERILRVAQELFGSRGCQDTSVREIAEELGLTKTAVLYHFSTKAEILAELAMPLLDDMAAAVDAAELLAAERVRWATVEGVLDAYLANREVLSLVIQNLGLFAQEPVFQRYFATMTRASELLAGPDPDLAARVRATQAIAMLSDPILLLTDAPTDPLRDAILSGVHRLLADPPSDAASTRKGRPGVMDAEKVAAARRMHQDGTHTADQIAATLGVSRATVYRYLQSH